MFFIPGIIISIITFPGVIVHEFAHQFFCSIFRVSVFEVCYFQFANPNGFVKHEEPRKPLHHILIGLGPFFVNTIVGALVSFPAYISVMKMESSNPLDYVLLWLGISIAMHSFPSIGDAQGIWSAIKKEETPWSLKIIFTPFVGLIYLGALGSFVWLDVAYGFLVAGLIPAIIGYFA